MRKAVKSKNLARELKHAILNGALRPEEMLPREVELAKLHEVSRDTVRAALEELEEQRLIRRIRGKGTIICAPARTCTSIKVILPGPGPLNWSMAKLMHGIITEAHLHGIRIETIMSTSDHQQSHMNFNSFQSLQPDDCVILPGLQWWRPILPVLADTRCKVVCLDSCNSDDFGRIHPYTQNWKRILIDFTELMRKAQNYLMKQGRKRTIIFQMSMQESRAYFEELKLSRIPFDHRWYIPYEYGYCIYTDKKQQKRDLRSYLLPRLKRAVSDAHADSMILNNSDIMESVIELFQEMEIQIPEDMSIIAVEDYSRIAAPDLPISAFQYPRVELGKRFVRCFLNDYFHPETIIQEPFLAERESSRKGAGNTPGIQDDVPSMEQNVSFY